MSAPTPAARAAAAAAAITASGLVPFLPLNHSASEPLPAEVRERPRASLRILGQEEAGQYKSAGAFGFSPSQVDTFRACPRKWAFAQIDKIYSPSGAGAALGGQVHAVWEDYLRDGKLPPTGTTVGKIASATLKYLPLPKVAEVEGETKMWTPLGIMTARIDFWIANQGDFPRASLGELPPPWDQYPDAFFDGVPLIGDHKTTSSFDYAKQPEDLIGDGTRDVPGDAQAGAYSMVATARRPTTKAVDLFWSYSRTKGAKGALPIRARHTLTTLDPALTYLFEDVARMRLYKETCSTANEVTPNPGDACDAFGGCPHRSRCKLTPEEREKALMAGNNDLASLLNVNAAPSAAAPSAPSAPAATGDLLAAALFGGGAPVSPASPAPTPSAPVSAAPASAPAGDLLAAALFGGGAPAPVNPASSAPASPPANPAPSMTSPAAPDETAEKLAARLFAAGKPLPETASPEVRAAYAKLLGTVSANPPDAAAATSSAPPSPPPETSPAPAVAVEEPKAEPKRRSRQSKVEKSEEPARAASAEGSDLGSTSIEDLYAEILRRHVDSAEYAKLCRLSSFLVNETQREERISRG